ncbi:hypothetical protein V2J09_014589 [Rumex salicifolius]
MADDERAGAEIVTDPDECHRRSMELLDEIGFPKGVLPLKGLIECGRVQETGFVWMKQKEPSEHFFEETKSLVSYATEVTCYVEKRKMKKMTGVKTKQAFFWVTLTEMTIDEANSRKIYFKTSLGVGRYFPIKAFMTPEEKAKYLEDKAKNEVAGGELKEDDDAMTVNA